MESDMAIAVESSVNVIKVRHLHFCHQIGYENKQYPKPYTTDVSMCMETKSIPSFHQVIAALSLAELKSTYNHGNIPNIDFVIPVHFQMVHFVRLGLKLSAAPCNHGCVSGIIECQGRRLDITWFLHVTM
jgi:hypothetical protein